MSVKTVAVPSMSPGGLEAMRAGHFGHCDLFTLIHLEDGEIKEVFVGGQPTPCSGRLFCSGQHSSQKRRSCAHSWRHRNEAVDGFSTGRN